MHVSWMEEQYSLSSLEHYLSILDQWYTCDGGSNTHKYLFSLVKELPIFEYKCANVKLSSSQARDDRIL
jgi:hypothetical protein